MAAMGVTGVVVVGGGCLLLTAVCGCGSGLKLFNNINTKDEMCLFVCPYFTLQQCYVKGFSFVWR